MLLMMFLFMILQYDFSFFRGFCSISNSLSSLIIYEDLYDYDYAYVYDYDYKGKIKSEIFFTFLFFIINESNVFSCY